MKKALRETQILRAGLFQGAAKNFRPAADPSGVAKKGKI